MRHGRTWVPGLAVRRESRHGNYGSPATSRHGSCACLRIRVLGMKIDEDTGAWLVIGLEPGLRQLACTNGRAIAQWSRLAAGTPTTSAPAGTERGAPAP